MKSLLIIAAMLTLNLSITGCQTVGNFRYVKAAEANDRGDYEDAFREYMILALDDGYDDQGSAQFSVGSFYLKGLGVERNPNEAIKWLAKSASNFENKKWAGLAANKLGQLYCNGVDGFVAQDKLRAAKCFLKARDLGEESSHYYINTMGEDPELYTQIYPEEFSPDGSTKPEKLADIKDFVDDDPKKAFRIASWHARDGSAKAQLFMARIYTGGIGIDQNKEQADRWLYLAAKWWHPRPIMPRSRIFHGKFHTN